MVTVVPRDARRTIREWRLSFSEGNEISAEDFLCRIEEIHRGTPIKDDDLLSAIPDLLLGVTKLWARQESMNWDNWGTSWTPFVTNMGIRTSSSERRIKASP